LPAIHLKRLDPLPRDEERADEHHDVGAHAEHPEARPIPDDAHGKEALYPPEFVALPDQPVQFVGHGKEEGQPGDEDRKSTRLNSSHVKISYAVFCLKKKST